MAFLTTTASALSLFSQLFMLLSRMAKLFGPELVGSKLLLAVSARLHQRRQRHAHHLAQRAHVIIGDPLPETALPLVEQRRTVEHAGDGLDGLEIGAPVVQPPDDAVARLISTLNTRLKSDTLDFAFSFAEYTA